MSEDPSPYAAPDSYRIRVTRETGTIWLMACGDTYLGHENQPLRSLCMTNEEHRAKAYPAAFAKELLAEVQERWHQAELV